MSGPSSANPFSRRNAPFTLVALVAGAVLTWFTLVFDWRNGTSREETIVPTTTGAIATTSPPVASEAADATTSTDAVPPAATTPLQGLGTEVLFEGLAQPVFATTAPGDDRIFILERRGTIQILDPATGTIAAEPFLDITARTRADSGIELGLLGMAFHPDYEDNGRFFIYYTDANHDTAVAEYSRLDPDRADPESGRVFISVQREGLRHYGGMLQFGPDGYLYISIGDGGLFETFGQDPSQFLGAILRLDMDSGDPYSTPDDNPFSSGGGAPEVWAYGLRNPWRFSIDTVTSTMFIGDVGQADAEEVDAVALEPGGYNFGWPIMEGLDCWTPRQGCDMTGLDMPVKTYAHDEGCAVTGGYVYRGSQIPEVFGHYFYADWCFGWIRSFELTDGEIRNERDWSQDIGAPGMITSFGLDSEGELLYTTFEGVLGRIIPVRTAP